MLGIIAGSFRVSFIIDLGCPLDFGTGWNGTFMISRSILHGSYCWKFSINLRIFSHFTVSCFAHISGTTQYFSALFGRLVLSSLEMI